VRRYVARNLGDAGAVLAVDETGFLKKGRMSAGVARQYTGTAGRVENAQVGGVPGVCRAGREQGADRPGAVPAGEMDGRRDRCRAAGIGDDVAFATKPQLAKSMIGRAVKAGVPFSWVTGDEAYGGNPGLREWLEKEKIPPTRSWPSPPAPPGPPRARRNLSLPAGTLPASRAKRGPDACGQIFAPPRTYAPPAFITDDSGRDLIPLTAGEARRLFNLHTRVTHPDEYHVRWSDWRRYRQAAARRSHYARRAEVPGHV